MTSTSDLFMLDFDPWYFEMSYYASSDAASTTQPSDSCKGINMVEWMNSDDEIIKAMSSKMFEKFEKYWSVVYIVLAVAVILDPRYKMKVVEFFFPMICGENAWSEIEQVKTTCYNLLTNYRSQIKSKSHGTSILPTQVTETQASMTPNMSIERISSCLGIFGVPRLRVYEFL
ncbi:hypothetical protein GH714_029728 [Hevea brasiliensis]|uniref:hAT-like transposase RNase-H fold domain-containing protein n=1 Tax=Hevea brasiliensis TaxID=3981 RepID=A0A6A6LNY6_HEVBR|nr:hypothetical protein GH714_029728 [Hevea brasiliensis]